jgi:DNA-binding transcriptional LysR family regulator
MSENNNSCSLLDLRKIKSFVSIADAKSFSKAATESLYSTSALSIQIRELEQLIGFRLLDRNGNTVTLTNEGEKFYKYASMMLSMNDQIFDAFSGNQEPTGRIRIGAIDSICDCLLTNLIADYEKKFPKVTISVASYSPRSLLKQLSENELDIVLMLDKPVADQHFTISESISEQIVVCCSPDFSLAKASNIDLETLLKYPAILTEKGESYRNSLETALAKEKMYLIPSVESKSTNLIIDLLKKNIGFSVLPKFIVKSDIENGSIIQIPVKGFDLNIQFQILYNSNKYLSHEMKSFINIAKNDIHVGN